MQFVVSDDCVTTMSTGHSMVARATPGQNGHTEANEVSRPSHHLTAVWNSGECRCRFSSTEGAIESQALAWGAEADNSQALFAGEEDIKSVSKRCSSNFWDRNRWQG